MLKILLTGLLQKRMPDAAPGVLAACVQACIDCAEHRAATRLTGLDFGHARSYAHSAQALASVDISDILAQL